MDTDIYNKVKATGDAIKLGKYLNILKKGAKRSQELPDANSAPLIDFTGTAKWADDVVYYKSRREYDSAECQYNFIKSKRVFYFKDFYLVVKTEYRSGYDYNCEIDSVKMYIKYYHNDTVFEFFNDDDLKRNWHPIFEISDAVAQELAKHIYKMYAGLNDMPNGDEKSDLISGLC